ncbi:MAG: cysteine dioxygenase [Flavobacteriales bacterium CG_4_10_14_0_2_um_filter_32_8]|nr:MAG: cysteine dioxygenase [Flavobacteriales bacterium CG_4_10_14_0_2_um_filter_32_8]
MKKITTIKQLITYLSENPIEQLKSIAQFLAIPKKEVEPYQFWSKKHYTRNCIIRTNNYELILICWEKNQYTPIHSHNNQECWVYHVQGNFEETRFKQDENGIPQSIHHSILYEQKHSYINDTMGFHVLKNTANGRAMSLHLYAKPIDKCLVYNENKQLFEMKPLGYFSVAGQLMNPDNN